MFDTFIEEKILRWIKIFLQCFFQNSNFRYQDPQMRRKRFSVVWKNSYLRLVTFRHLLSVPPNGCSITWPSWSTIRRFSDMASMIFRDVFVSGRKIRQSKSSPWTQWKKRINLFFSSQENKTSDPRNRWNRKLEILTMNEVKKDSYLFEIFRKIFRKKSLKYSKILTRIIHKIICILYIKIIYHISL